MDSSSILRKVTAAALILTLAGSAAGAAGADPGMSVTAGALAGDMSLSDVFCYQENEDGSLAVCEIIQENSVSSEIVIPETYEGRAVTVIQSAPMARVESGKGEKVFDLTIGKNIREIQPGAFEGLHIGDISVDANNPSFTAKDGMLFTKDMTTLVYCPDTAQGTVTIPAGTVSINEDAFSSDSITAIILGADVSDVPDGAFINCSSLTSFGVDKANPYFTAVNGMLLNKNCSVVYAYPKAKTGVCQLPAQVRTISDYAFYGSAVEGVDTSGVKSIGAYAFADCDSLKGVTVYLNNTDLGDGIYSGCDKLTSAVIEKGIKQLPAALFADCTSLTSISFPTSVISMGFGVFDNTMWYRKKADGFIYIAKMLYGYKGSSTTPVTLTIKDGTAAIADGALKGADVTKISIPSSLRYLEAGDIYPAENVAGFEVAADNPYFTAVNNFLFSKDRTKLICAPCVYGSDSCSLPLTVTEIGDYAFTFNRDIKNIYCSENITKFGISPFNNGDEERAVVCMEGSPAAQAAKEDDVNRIYMETGISLSASEVTLGISETKTLQATVTPDIASKNVTWSSSAPSIVSVVNGNITALASGTAVITARENSGKTASCAVTVLSAPENVILSKTNLTMGLSETQYITARTNEGSSSAITYTTSDSSVASVTLSGGQCRISVHKIGTATVTAHTFNGKTAECKITVKASPDNVTLSKEQITIGVGEQVTISSAVNDGAASTTRNYTSSDTDSVQIIPTSWNCTFVGNSVGTSVITVRTYNGKSAQCKVTVKSPPKSVSMEKTSIEIGVGEEASLGSVIGSSEASADRTYRSSNSNIVKMTKTNWTAGFKGIKEGTANVTVKTYNAQEGSCKVTVKPAPTSVTISKTTLNLKVGQTAKLTSSVPAGTAGYNRTWSSTNSSVVKMTSTSGTGKFTALKAGTCYVKVRTFNGKEASCKIVVS